MSFGGLRTNIDAFGAQLFRHSFIRVTAGEQNNGWNVFAKRLREISSASLHSRHIIIGYQSNKNFSFDFVFLLSTLFHPWIRRKTFALKVLRFECYSRHRNRRSTQTLLTIRQRVIQIWAIIWYKKIFLIISESSWERRLGIDNSFER